jgi:Citrate lyase ligase C-terminal domain.
MDIGIFAEYIAPALNIKIRFAGEEPLDPITRQYNVEMKRTLTDYGMQFIEIPRKELSGEVISASRVRKLLKSGEFDEIRKLVPDVTYQYLLEKHQRTSDM